MKFKFVFCRSPDLALCRNSESTILGNRAGIFVLRYWPVSLSPDTTIQRRSHWLWSRWGSPVSTVHWRLDLILWCRTWVGSAREHGDSRFDHTLRLPPSTSWKPSGSLNTPEIRWGLFPGRRGSTSTDSPSHSLGQSLTGHRRSLGYRRTSLEQRRKRPNNMRIESVDAFCIVESATFLPR